MSMKSSRVKTRDSNGKPTAWFSTIQQPKDYDNRTKQSFKDETDVVDRDWETYSF